MQLSTSQITFIYTSKKMRVYVKFVHNIFAHISVGNSCIREYLKVIFCCYLNSSTHCSFVPTFPMKNLNNVCMLLRLHQNDFLIFLFSFRCGNFYKTSRCCRLSLMMREQLQQYPREVSVKKRFFYSVLQR